MVDCIDISCRQRSSTMDTSLPQGKSRLYGVNNGVDVIPKRGRHWERATFELWAASSAGLVIQASPLEQRPQAQAVCTTNVLKY